MSREVLLEVDREDLIDALLKWVEAHDGVRMADGLRDSRRMALRKALRHDVQGPLAVILGQAELVGFGSVDSRQRESLEAIQRNCERLSALLRALADEHAPN